MLRENKESWLLGLLGGPRVIYSPSPRMHMAALVSCQLKGEYFPLEVEPKHLCLTMTELTHAGYQGLNITNPHKTAIKQYLCGFSDEAQAIGSVNTLILTDDGYYGENTDARGFQAAYLDNLEKNVERKALVLGSGGASRAVIAALKGSSIQPLIAARDLGKSRVVAKHFDLNALDWTRLNKGGPYDLVVNTTEVSHRDEFEPGPPDIELNKGALVIDINYGRIPNFFKDLAFRSGAVFHDGLAMLAHQARLSFNHWTAMDPGLEPFLTALDNYIKEKRKAAN
jgi:shikimate dehydrogenase